MKRIITSGKMKVSDALKQMKLLGEPKEKPIAQKFSFPNLYRTKEGNIGKHMNRCSEVVGYIEKDSTMHVVSIAEWSMEHLIAHITDQIGRCNLMLATWSISNDAATKLCSVINAGLFESVRILFDWRVKVRKPSALTMIKMNLDKADIRLHSCHAKVYLLWNNNYHIVIVGSPNLTTNPRIEAIVITESKELFEFHYTWLTEIINGAEPFEV